MANQIPWIMFAVLGLILVLFVVFIKFKDVKEKQGADYRNLFNMGVSWLYFNRKGDI